MAMKILINATEEEECRVAVLKHGVLHEFYIERPSMETCFGNIYRGRVVNIEPSIGAAFVEIGASRNGFLHASDVNPMLLNREGASPEPSGRKTDSKIDELLTIGQEIDVQVSRDGIGDKGPTLTTYISLAGRFLVFMPGVSRQGVSRKIEDDTERERLKTMISELTLPSGMGVIVRTAGAHQLKREIRKDIHYLTRIWKVIQKRSGSLAVPATLYKENDLVIRVLRDIFSSQMSEVLVDSGEVFRRARDFMKIIMPRQGEKVRLYKGKEPLFDRYKVEGKLKSIFDSRITLDSGGSLFIEQTEALVAIDVNSGRYKGEELEETAFAINKEASREIARQLRLRDLGGLIIIDFIDMVDAAHRRSVEKEFRDALKHDRARIKVAKISPFGVIEMTRQRVRPSLKSFVYEKCPHCDGTGFVASRETLGLELIRKIRLWVLQKKKSPLIRIVVNDRMADYILNSKRLLLMGLEEKSGKRIIIKGDPALQPGEIRHVSEAEPIDQEAVGQRWSFIDQNQVKKT